MQKLIVANWKSNKNRMQVENFFNNFPSELLTTAAAQKIRLILAPPYPFLEQISVLLKELALPIELAVQDISAYDAGAYTGEVSAENLAFLEVALAIVGHSERRRLLGESNQMIVEKVKRAQAAQIQPLLCVDDLELEKQLELLTEQEKENLFLAYEPQAAIGSGTAADLETVKAFFARARALVPAKNQLRLLYGGSVKADNVADYLAISDGILVGGASLELASLTALLRQAQASL